MTDNTGLKLGGKYSAKAMFEVDGVPLHIKTPLDHGFVQGDCLIVTGSTVNENLSKVVSNGSQDPIWGTVDLPLGDAEFAKRKKDWKLRQTNFGSGALRKRAQRAGAAGAVTHPASSETNVHADV